MYYNTSLNLIKGNLLDKDAIGALDREIAHVYAPGGKGNAEQSLLAYKSGVNISDLQRLITLFEADGVVSSYQSVSCPCNQTYNPADGQCIVCNRPLSLATPTGETVYNVLIRPEEPAYDPKAQVAHPKVFISYRHYDTKTLAADIFYLIQLQGIPVFLDNGIPVGAEAEQVFLSAASEAEYFIALVSENYFESPYCKKEIAHAARCGRRIIRVNIDPIPVAPAGMSWVDTPNWNPQKGNGNGLDLMLQRSLLLAIKTSSSAPNADLRKEACIFLMEDMTFNTMGKLWNRLPWMVNIQPASSISGQITQISQETGLSRLPTLCNALAPERPV